KPNHPHPNSRRTGFREFWRVRVCTILPATLFLRLAIPFASAAAAVLAAVVVVVAAAAAAAVCVLVDSTPDVLLNDILICVLSTCVATSCGRDCTDNSLYPRCSCCFTNTHF